MSDDSAAGRLAARLAREWEEAGVTSVTWLNHHSALEVRRRGMVTVAPFTYVGVDGLLLLRLLGAGPEERTSADLVLPRLLPRLAGARIALVGTDRRSLDRAAEIITEELITSDSTVVDTRDGYDELPSGSGIEPWLRSCRPDVVVVGLGAGLQESWALDVADRLSSGLVVTCGGFLDQLHQPGYYPAWAYALRLNWAVRLARDPRRLWRRYSIEALHAIRGQRALCREIESLAGYHTHRAVVIGHAREGS